MKIVVAIKQVPARDSLLKVNASGAWIDDADLSWEINEPDAYALEAGLQLREAASGEVVVLCAGPERATQTIREADGRRARIREARCHPHRPSVGRSRLRANRRDSRRSARLCACDARHEH